MDFDNFQEILAINIQHSSSLNEKEKLNALICLIDEIKRGKIGFFCLFLIRSIL